MSDESAQAFLKRPILQRTPPPQAASQNRESPRRKSPTKQVAYEENATIKGTLKSMGTALDALSALFGGQRHITLSMRDELAKIIELQKLLTSLSSPILAAVEVQVTPSLEQRRGKTAGATGESSGVACTPKRMRESLPGPRKTPSKKPRRQGPFTKEAGVAVPHDKEDWTLVKSRQSMSKRSKPMQEPGTMRHLKPRPDAILIEAKASDHEPILFSIGSTDRRDRRQVYCGRAYKESTLNYQTFANVMGNLQVYGSAKQMSDQLAQHLKRVCEASMATKATALGATHQAPLAVVTTGVGHGGDKARPAMDSGGDVERAEAEMLSSFSLRPRIARTPPGGPLSAPPTVTEPVFRFGPAVATDTPKRGRDASSPGNVAEAAAKKVKTQRSLVAVSEELGDLIEEIIQAFRPKAARHITQANRDLFARMKELQTEITRRLAEKEPENAELPEDSSNSPEVAIRSKPVEREFRKSSQEKTTQTTPPRKLPAYAPSHSRQSSSGTKSAPRQGSPTNTVAAGSSSPAPSKGATRKQHVNEPRKQRPRADVIIIQPEPGKSYSDILRLVTRREDNKLQSVGEHVRRVRKTAQNGLVLELDGDCKATMDKMKADIGDALGQQARVRAISQETSLEIRDIDCLATREDILAALASHTDAPLDESVIKTLRPGYDDERKMREIVETLFPGSTNFQPLDPTPTPQLFLEAPTVTVD
ncbi:hypothetical protein ACLKA6_016460 [Drosophila palustris]